MPETPESVQAGVLLLAGLELSGSGAVDGDASTPVPYPAARCRQCGRTTVPRNPGCRACGSTDLDAVGLGPCGVLWSQTVDRFGVLLGRPAAVAWVRFPEGPIAPGYLLTDVDALPVIGTEVETVSYRLPGGPFAGGLTAAFRVPDPIPAGTSHG